MTNTQYDPTHPASMICYLAEVEWKCPAHHAFTPPITLCGVCLGTGFVIPFLALRVPCPNIVNGGAEFFAHLGHPCVCNGRFWIPEPDVERACWEAVDVPPPEELECLGGLATSDSAGNFIVLTREQRALLACCRWAEQQVQSKEAAHVR